MEYRLTDSSHGNTKLEHAKVTNFHACSDEMFVAECISHHRDDKYRMTRLKEGCALANPIKTLDS